MCLTLRQIEEKLWEEKISYRPSGMSTSSLPPVCFSFLDSVESGFLVARVGEVFMTFIQLESCGERGEERGIVGSRMSHCLKCCG